jgi:predicted dehydrogenase
MASRTVPNLPTPLPRGLPDPPLEPGPERAEPLPADRPVRWGMLATGKIAGGFARDLALLPDARIAAVGARRLASAEAFAAEHGGRPHEGYEALVADPDVDVVYVASPHALHREHVLLAFEAGKPVLCEKALTLNAAEAEELVAESRRRGLFLMEAMWMRCNPLVRRVQQLLATGELGPVTQVRADLGFRVDDPPTGRMLDPGLGGGALLDMGVYPVTFAHLFLGAPDRVAAVAALSEAGADLNLAMSFGYPSGAVAALTASMVGPTPRTASIATDRGRFDLPGGFHHPVTATWTSEDHVEVIEAPVIGTGLANEAIEVMRCLRAGETESPLVPLDETVEIMRVMDDVRRQVGVVYAVDAATGAGRPGHSRGEAG